MIAALAIWAAISAAPRQPARASNHSGKIRGVVVDAATSAPIADAQVAIGDTTRAVVTGVDGRFTFDDVAAGEVTLAASRIGYIFVYRRVTVADDATIELTFALTAGTGTYQERVTVAGSAPSLSNRSVQLNSADLQELRGIGADDPIRALQALPGVAASDDFQAEFSVRGSAFRHVGYVIDGTATPLLTHAVRGEEDTGSISMINTDVLARASLHAGPHALTQGDWIGPSVEFDLREGSRDRTGLRGAVSATFASAVIEGPVGRSKRGSWLLSTRVSYIDWLLRRVDPDIVSTIGFTDVQAKAVYDIAARQQIEFAFVGGDADYRNDQARTANQVNRADSTSLLSSLRWRYSASRVVFAQRLAVVTNDFRNTGAVGQEGAIGTARALIWSGDAAIAINNATTLNAGLRSEEQDDTRTQREFSTTSTGGIRVRTQIDGTGSRRVDGAWMQLDQRYRDWHVDAGLRVSHDTRSSQTEALPWLAVDRNVGRWRIEAAAGRAAQFPAFQIAGTHSEPPLQELAHGVDLGAAFHLTATTTVGATLYDRREHNILRRTDEERVVDGVRVPASAFVHTAASLRGRSRGAEIVLRRQAPSGLTGWFAYSWTHTRYDDVETGEQFDGDFDQRHTLNVFAQQRLSFRTALSAKLRVGSNFPIVGYFDGTPEALTLGSVRNAVRMPVYARLDLRGSRTFTFERRRLTLFVELMNVTGRHNFGPADGVVRVNRVAEGYIERLLPFVPSAGILIEF